MLRLTLSIMGQKEFDLLLSRIGERSANLRQPLTEILASMRLWSEKTFRTEGAYPGPRWARLDPTYASRKASKFAGRTILRRSDRLYRSLTRRAPGSIGRVSKNRLEYGTSVEHAFFHQEGTRRMTARPPLRFIERDVRRWIRILQLWAFPRGAER
jgi:phage gpG-like protein